MYKGNVVDLEYLDKDLYDRFYEQEKLTEQKEFVVLHWPMKVKWMRKEKKWSEEFMQKIMEPKEKGFPTPTKFKLLPYNAFPMGAAKLSFKTKGAAHRVFNEIDGLRVFNRTLRTTVKGLKPEEMTRGLKKRLLRKQVSDAQNMDVINGSLCGRNIVRTVPLNLKQLSTLRKINGGRVKRELMHKALYQNIRKAKWMRVRKPRKRKTVKGENKI